MKIPLFLLFLLTTCFAGFTQSEFAPNGAEWYYNYGEGAQTPATGYYLLKSIKDTIIDSKACKVLSRTLVNSQGIFFNDGQSIVYHDTKENKIFRYVFGNFYLLYDFTKVAGDTIVIKEPYSASSFDSIVSIVDSVGIETFQNNIQLKSLYIHQINQFKYIFSGKIIEKIGNIYFFFPVNSLNCDSGCPQPLRCYNDTSIKFSFLQIACDTIYSNSDFKENGEINVFPNPFTSSFTIRNNTCDEGILSIKVFNFLGQLILQDIIPRNIDHYINLSEYPNGLYYLRIKSRGKNAVYKIIKTIYLP